MSFKEKIEEYRFPLDFYTALDLANKQMSVYLHEYGIVTVADFYDIMEAYGISLGTPKYQDFKIGWEDPIHDGMIVKYEDEKNRGYARDIDLKIEITEPKVLKEGP